MSKKIIFFVLFILLLGLLSFVSFAKYKKDPSKELIENNKTLISEKNENAKITRGLFVDYEQNLSNDFYINFEVNDDTKNLVEPEKESLKDLNLSLLEQRSYKNLGFGKISLNLNEQNFSKKNVSKIDEKNLEEKEKKPRLAIIIDDMSSKEQVKALKNTGLKLIPSFFPNSKNHPNTKEYAKEFDFFMVHLPLAAVKFRAEELQTLKPSHSQELIKSKIAKIKNDFKGLKFINNHTGSLFTSDEEAMRKLFIAFKENDFIFVDSLTTGSSKARILAKEFKQSYIKRDIFLDNKDELEYIKKQLLKAVTLAKKQGFAIAIGHPRKNTFKALSQSKNLLNEVELVYLSEVYEYN